MTTLQDIAVAVGVTPTTVANALKGKGNVSEATKQRILKCAAELKYRPNLLARGLAQGKSYTLGFLLPTIANPFYPEIAEAIERTAQQHGYQMLLGNTLYDPALGQQQLDRLAGDPDRTDRPDHAQGQRDQGRAPEVYEAARDDHDEGVQVDVVADGRVHGVERRQQRPRDGGQGQADHERQGVDA